MAEEKADPKGKEPLQKGGQKQPKRVVPLPPIITKPAKIPPPPKDPKK